MNMEEINKILSDVNNFTHPTQDTEIIENTSEHEDEEAQEDPTYALLSNTNNRDVNNIPEEDVYTVDPEMYKLLASWGFVDLYEHFSSQKMNVDILKYISNDDLKDLFSNKPFGIRVEFKHKLNQWRKENVNT